MAETTVCQQKRRTAQVAAIFVAWNMIHQLLFSCGPERR